MLSRIVLVGAIFLGSAALSNAAPLDTPDPVYIGRDSVQQRVPILHGVGRARSSQVGRHNSARCARRRAARTFATKPKSAARDRVAKQAAATAPPNQSGQDRARAAAGESALPLPPKSPRTRPVEFAPTLPHQPPPLQSAVTPTPVIFKSRQSECRQSECGREASRTNRRAAATEPRRSGQIPRSTLLLLPSRPQTRDAGTKTVPFRPGDRGNSAGGATTSSANRAPELHAMNGEPHNGGQRSPRTATCRLPQRVDAFWSALVMSRPEIKSVADLAAGTTPSTANAPAQP